MPDIYEILGNRVREERKRSGLTIERLAELAGISTSFLAYIEGNKKKASLDTVGRLARALRIPVSELLTFRLTQRKDAAHNAAMGFAQLVRDKGPAEIAAVLKVAKAAAESFPKSKKAV